jgi:hypothetical protein
MDAERFDTLTRRVANTRTRRGFLTGLSGGLLVILSEITPSGALAKRRKKKRKKKKKNDGSANCEGRECGGRCGTCRGGKTCVDGTCICFGSVECGETCFAVLECGPNRPACPDGLFCCTAIPGDVGFCRRPTNAPCDCFDQCCLDGSQSTGCLNGLVAPAASAKTRATAAVENVSPTNVLEPAW